MLHTINLAGADLSLLSGHLRMAGRDPRGCEINANSRYLTLGGAPWLPVMGEMHFSRCPRAGWRDALLKMRAGGVTVVAT
jgi:beta-galactosidase